MIRAENSLPVIMYCFADLQSRHDSRVDETFVTVVFVLSGLKILKTFSGGNGSGNTEQRICEHAKSEFMHEVTGSSSRVCGETYGTLRSVSF